jgi:hypothetical protein
MKNIIAFLAIAATFTLGCAPTVVVDEPCLTCSDAIAGADVNETNACSGSLSLWQLYKSQVCQPDSLCNVYCYQSLCAGKAPSSDCKDCSKFGTVIDPNPDFDYLTCKADK